MVTISNVLYVIKGDTIPKSEKLLITGLTLKNSQTLFLLI